MSPCPTPLGTTRSLARSKGSKPAICPRAKVHAGPHCAPLHSPRPRCQGAEGDIPTLSLSAPTPVNSGVRFILRKLGSKARRRRRHKEAEGARCVCLRRAAGAEARSRASHRQHLALNVSRCVCVLQLTPLHTFARTHRQSVCAGGGR